jgi:hypothetical protein
MAHIVKSYKQRLLRMAIKDMRARLKASYIAPDMGLCLFLASACQKLEDSEHSFQGARQKLHSYIDGRLNGPAYLQVWLLKHGHLTEAEFHKLRRDLELQRKLLRTRIEWAEYILKRL